MMLSTIVWASWTAISFSMYLAWQYSKNGSLRYLFSMPPTTDRLLAYLPLQLYNSPSRITILGDTSVQPPAWAIAASRNSMEWWMMPCDLMYSRRMEHMCEPLMGDWFSKSSEMKMSLWCATLRKTWRKERNSSIMLGAWKRLQHLPQLMLRWYMALTTALTYIMSISELEMSYLLPACSLQIWKLPGMLISTTQSLPLNMSYTTNWPFTSFSFECLFSFCTSSLRKIDRFCGFAFSPEKKQNTHRSSFLLNSDPSFTQWQTAQSARPIGWRAAFFWLRFCSSCSVPLISICAIFILPSAQSYKVIILLMERLKQKELQREMESLKQKTLKQDEAARAILKDENVSTILKYCRKVLGEPVGESLGDYCPTNLSKFIFEEQLEKARVMMEGLPNKQCRIDHFLLIMISIMKFPFEKWPYYLLGFKDMFHEVAQKTEYITYPKFFKYIIGEVLDFKEEEQNTEFQVRFEELKKQDYLMHDNGVAQFYYSTDTKTYMTLDEGSYVIKLYNKEMKIVGRFTPNKEKHGKKYPHILSFDYSEMSGKLGLTLADNTVSIINFTNFLGKSKFEFDSLPSNEVVVSFPEKVLKIFYIQMLNRWALFTSDNRLRILDMEKYKTGDPEHLTEIKMENPDLKLTHLLELVNLSMVCVVAGNEVYFLSENLTESKHGKFVHGTNIKVLRHSEELGSFYLCGDEKTVTLFNPGRNWSQFQISTFTTVSKYNISTFEVFPLFNTMTVVDQNHDVRLYDLAQGICYQQNSYANIVKNEDKEIKMLKISKSEFALYETYTLIFQKEKIAIEKDSEFFFKPETYFHPAKEEFYISVNNQIISFSVAQGEIRKSYNMDTANVPKHDFFMVDSQAELFLIDHKKSIYQAYLKESMPEGENKTYQKSIAITTFVAAFYDEEIRIVFVVGARTLHTIRNDGSNSFTISSSLSLEGFPPIASAQYNSHTKQMQLLLSTQEWLVINLMDYTLQSFYGLNFPSSPNDHDDTIIIQHDQDVDYEFDVLMTNHNEVYLVSKGDFSNCMYIKIADYLSYKLRQLEFNSFRYCKRDQQGQIYLLLSDKTGYLLELNLTRELKTHFKDISSPFQIYKCALKDLHTLENIDLQVRQVELKSLKSTVVDKKFTNLFKAHDKAIEIKERIFVEGFKTITFASDGHIKLWEGCELLFNLRLPDLKKLVWNMDKIEKVKNERSIEEAMKVLNALEGLQEQKEKKSVQMLLKLSDMRKNQDHLKQLKHINLDEPIPIEIEKKEIEEIVQKTQSINWYTQRHDSKRRDREMSLTQRTNPHPWRTKNSFLKILEKASPDQSKYHKKMPRDLIVLRNSLDMKDRRESRTEDKKELYILPELKKYLEENKREKKREVSKESLVGEQENEEAFESCLYVKKSKNNKKLNELDEIDKEFKKKWLALTAKKYVPKSESRKKSKTDQRGRSKSKMESYYNPVSEFKYDPIQEVKSIFELHNRETSNTKKGRFIKIPNISLTREDIFSND